MAPPRSSTARVHRIPHSSPDDVQGLERAVQAKQIHVPSIVAILGKTEGNGCVNDFTRAFAVQSLKTWLGKYLKDTPQDIDKVCLVMSGGTEGGISPHWIVLEVRDSTEDESVATSPYGQSLAIGVAHSLNLPCQDLGRLGQVRMVATTVQEAMTRAGITQTQDVHFVQIKCPLLTTTRVQQTQQQGYTTATKDTLNSMKLSRGASALGVAVALNELSLDDISDDQIGRDWSLFSGRASTSGGVELLNHEVVVLGMSSEWKGPLAVDHAVMKDGIDVEPIRDALQRLDVLKDGSSRFQLTQEEQQQVVCLLSKAEASSSGKIRGNRHAMNDDSDISSTRHARGFVAGAIAGLIGHTELFVSGGAEHQGPDGGGPVAVIVDRSM
mmetsp:Transcript_5848/g.11443  ORF Transcript_5848/g.11443 Transcript_5848/m.11443 type:complete len:383 (-) Transcript_5848:90-1238(-)|eukprot:scaffold3980_cov168-Amphora_coffeaeformis.AAC.3